MSSIVASITAISDAPGGRMCHRAGGGSWQGGLDSALAERVCDRPSLQALRVIHIAVALG